MGADVKKLIAAMVRKLIFVMAAFRFKRQEEAVCYERFTLQ